mgnify:CR=1 FL=1
MVQVVVCGLLYELFKMNEIKEMENDECGKEILEDEGLIVERLPNKKLAIYRDYNKSNLKRLKRGD